MSRKFTAKRFQLKRCGRMVKDLFSSKGPRNVEEKVEKVEVRPVLAPAPVKKKRTTKKK